MIDFYLTKSTQISVDEIPLNMMRSIPDKWTPASHNGVKVKAYREQPITYRIQ